VWKCEAPGGLLKAIKFVEGGLHACDTNAPAEEELRAIERVKAIRHPFILSMGEGSVVAEGWWSPYGREYPHMLFSLSKSFTSTAIGLAVNEGHLSVDDTVLSFFPDEAPAEVSKNLAAMRVQDLLTMSTSLP